MGYAPFAPHLLYTSFLDDDDLQQRALGIQLGLQFMEACDEVWIYTGNGMSEGMQTERSVPTSLANPSRRLRSYQNTS